MLQGKNVYAHDMVKSLNGFQLKLKLFLQHLLIKKVDHFPTLKLLKIPENKFEKYVEIINALSDDFSRRFGDFRKIEASLAIVRDPFIIDIDSVPSELQLDIIDLQCDFDLREFHRREKICKFYHTPNSEKFAKLKDFARKMLVIFGLTYICEQTFSIMNKNKNSLRSSITDEHLKSVLRISTANLTPDINFFLKDVRQFHPSH